MKAVLISIRPKWCEKICHEIGTDKNGKTIYEKPIEVRKTKPSIPTPFKCHIYCCKAKSQWRYSNYDGAYENSEGKIVYAQQHVIGEFICDKIEKFDIPYTTWDRSYLKDLLEKSCLTYNDLYDYICRGGIGYGWHISQLKIYDKPKELSEFYKIGAESLDELDDGLCRYCAPTKYGERRVHLVPNAGAAFCEGDYCEEAYQKYLEKNFALTRPPQSWCYVQELEERK